MVDNFLKIILLVEDDAIIALEETFTLEKNGYTVVSVCSGEEAVEIAVNSQNIDLVLMDINLGDGMDGIEAARLILKEKEIPLIFLSSHMEKEIVEKTECVTSYGYITKNSSEAVMLTSIKMAFKLFAARQDIKTTDQYLKNANDTLDSIFNSINDAIALINMDSRIEKCNEAFKIISGRDEKNIIGMKCMDLIHEKGLRPPECPFIRMLKSGKREKMELPLNGKIYEVIVDPLFDNDGKMIKAVHIITDITERKQAEEALNKQLSELLLPVKDDDINLKNLLDTDSLRKLQDSFC